MRPEGSAGRGFCGAPSAPPSERSIVVTVRRRPVSIVSAFLAGDLRFDERHQLALLVVETRLGRVSQRAPAAIQVELEILHRGAANRLALAAAVVGKNLAAAAASTSAA